MTGYDVLIQKNATGEIRRQHEDLEWHEWTLYWWTDGNFGCDCNREWEFQRAAGEPLTEDPKCGYTKYRVIKAIFPDGKEIEIDGEAA